jgi:hypothetical protein
MSAAAFASLTSRSQQIFPGEVLAAYAALKDNLETLRGRDVIFFIDNEAATSALIRGSTKEADVMSIVQAAHWELINYDIRAWFEWIDSDANPSDGLSRDGLDDEWTLRQNWNLEIASNPDWDSTGFHESLALRTLGLSETALEVHWEPTSGGPKSPAQPAPVKRRD